jgi:hypothetical protein
MSKNQPKTREKGGKKINIFREKELRLFVCLLRHVK